MMYATMRKENEFDIDIYDGLKFQPGKFHADAMFYPHGCFGYIYRGDIYDDNGKKVGDYGANDESWIKRNFQIEWRSA